VSLGIRYGVTGSNDLSRKISLKLRTGKMNKGLKN
jgi:hypothetical protein